MRSIHFYVILLLTAALAGCGSGSGSTSKTVSSSNGTGTSGSATTLSAQTANNTSASPGFINQSNGNLGANNVSKVNVHTLLYPGATTKVLAHMMLWFGGSNHMNIGYNSDDATQVQKQITDMVSRGIDGVIVDWYGPNNSIDDATKMVMHEAEKHAGFTFAIMVDAGAMGNSCSGCNAEQSLINLLQYVSKTYFGSSSYMKVGGVPVVTNFNVDPSNQIDWKAVKSALSGSVQFLFQDQAGFTHDASDGSYSWVMPTIGDYGLGYLSSFYDTGMGYSGEQTVGATYKGFNDSLAGWGSNRVMDQQCGQTWLQTFQQINQLYSQSHQLPYLQLVTWNDYEEATEIESGIDPCLALQASITGNTLQWSVSGNENTVDHYSIYSSSDGQNLTELTETKPGTHSEDLCSLGVPSGDNKVYVQAVGKPMMANRMPGPVSYTASCGS